MNRSILKLDASGLSSYQMKQAESKTGQEEKSSKEVIVLAKIILTCILGVPK